MSQEDRKVRHGSRTIVEGHEETYRFMVNLKMSMPEKYDRLLPVAGYRDKLLHSAKASLQRYSPAGIQVICRSSGVDDKHVLGSRTTDGAITDWWQYSRTSGIVF